MLTAKQMDLISRIAAGSSIERAAKAAGVSHASAFRWLADPDFKAALDRSKAAIFDKAISELRINGLKAAAVLVSLMKSKNETTRRLSAATILEINFRVKEEDEIGRRLDRLERLVEKNADLGGH